MLQNLWRHHALIFQLAKRDVIGRYRGSILGLLWSMFYPVLMLIVYTFVFGVIFKARWEGTKADSQLEFAIVLFTGLIVFSLFSECLNRAPGLVLNTPNFVKKVVFPLEVLPWVAMASCLFHFVVSLAVLLAFTLAVHGTLNVTIVALPLILLPLILLTMGISWVLASLGVYLRDVNQSVSILTAALMFLSPIFYPLAAIPAQFRGYFKWNPFAWAIEQSRGVVIWGTWPDWGQVALLTAIGYVIAWAGLAWFNRTRGGFADVL